MHGRSLRVAVIDNYDSFTYNLVQYLSELGARTRTYRNDAVSLDELADHDALVISPGPGTPDDAGISLEAVQDLSGKLPILGVCLGHQVIAQAFGGRVVRGEPVHGKTALVSHDGNSPFEGMPDPFEATRYHSLVVERTSVPSDLQVSAWTEDAIVMGLRHTDHPTLGVQFHPESVLTLGGRHLLDNFLRLADL
ncbi:MAG: aminodeoxychorismate/anthranilate synthase component II, partial [Candidatus Dormibacteraeota bacterium]|nr:aminodeoxychorismate/anthranilate synthase component II [Candidatus Dormibacteraeota bacterium]